MTTSSWYKGPAPDLQKTEGDAATAAGTTTAGSYDKIIRLPLVKNKKYKFWFTYLYEDAETKKITEGPRSPIVESAFDIPNLTKPVLNLTVTASYRAYGVKFDFDPTSVQEDVIIYESLTGLFAGEEYIVYVGNSTNVTIQTGSTAKRWVKVVVRDKWLDTNRSSSAIVEVTPLNPDPDTTFTVANPTTATASASIDPKDLSGFSVVSTINWAVSADTRAAGYSIRWSTTNPSTGTPLWEYASVAGRTTNTYTATGLIPNTTYYYQVTSVTPYDVPNWTGVETRTFIASDADGTAAGALARLKSFIAIGGVSQDLFKIGTGIAQSINLNTEPLASPTLTAGTYHGIILNKSTTNVGNNFWLTTGQFRVGNSTEFMYWNGTDLNLTGNINATGGKFTGNVQLAVPTGGTTSGSLYAGASATSGARLRLNDQGLFAYDGLATDATVSITKDGTIDARKGYIGGWTITATSQTSGTISRNNTIFDSNGNIAVGDKTGTLGSAVRLSATDPTYRLWVGSTSSSNAPFRVDANGKLYANGAVLGSGSTIDGYATSATVTGVANRLTTVENNYVTSTTLSTGLATKNTTFVQGTTPTAVRAGDLWIDTANNNVLKTWTGSSWTERTNTTYASKTDLNSKLNASAYLVQSVTDNKISADANGFEVYSGSASTTGSGVKITGGGILGYKNGNPTFTITSSGDATFYGNLSGATGSFTGAVTATSGTIGGFTLTGGTDFTAKLDVNPRIMFGNKVLIGSIDLGGTNGDYGMRIGNPYGSLSQSFRVNTKDDVNRISVDTSRTLVYAAEITNDLRARDVRWIRNGTIDSSSRRFKENIVYTPKRYYDRVLDISPAFYNYKTDSDEVDDLIKGTQMFGFIVEDLEDAGLGYFVQRNLNGQPTSLKDPWFISALLIPLVKEMKQEISSLQSKVLELESR